MPTALPTSQVSRTGSRLSRERLVFSSRFGRYNAWTLTPAGAVVAPLVRTAAGP